MKIGKWDRLYGLLKKISNLYRKKVCVFLHRNKYDLLASNKDLKGVLAGKRCFVLGNGPSIKSQDLSLLKDDVVFTVNQAARHSDFDKIRTNYHFWTDPNLFNVEETSDVDMSIISLMRKVKTENNDPICFFPLKQKEFVKRYHLDEFLNIRYISPELGWLYEDFDEEFDLTKPIQIFGTVVQFAIAAALYMGASEIYILGCDNTGIVNTITSLLEENGNDSHGYEISEEERIRMQRTAQRNGLELDTLAYLNDIKSYRILNDYCRRRGILLGNCSARTVIDSLPRYQYESMFECSKESIK